MGLYLTSIAPRYNYLAKTAAYNALPGDFISCSSSSFTVTFPLAAANPGAIIATRHNGSSLTQVYTIGPTGSDTIQDAASQAMYTNSEVCLWTNDGVRNWFLQSHSTETGWIDGGSPYITTTNAYVFSWTGNQSIVAGATYSDGAGNVFTVSLTTNTTTGTFSGTGTPAATGTLTRVTGSGVTPISWTSRTITGVPVKGTTSLDKLWWKRLGANVLIRYDYIQTAGGTTGTGQYILKLLPDGMPLDTTTIALNVANAGAGGPKPYGQYIGSGWFSTTSNTQEGPVMLLPYSTNTFRLLGSVWGAAPTSSNGLLGSGQSTVLGATQVVIHIEAQLPISGWLP